MTDPTDPYDPEEHGMATHEQSDMTKKDWEDVAREKKGLPKRKITDLAAIDLEVIKTDYPYGNREVVIRLIAAVEALRERVTELEEALESDDIIF